MQTITPRTIQDTMDLLPNKAPNPLAAPVYKHDRPEANKVMLAVEDMQRHMTDEGWQIAAGLESAGYLLAGRRLGIDTIDVGEIMRRTEASCVVMQDKREWDVDHNNFRDKTARFIKYRRLTGWPDVFKLTILKDSHQRNEYHAESAQEIGCHAWIVYYHPRIVQRLAPFVRPEHLIRTYHSLDAAIVPAFNYNRHGTLISGAVSSVYPLRRRLINDVKRLPKTQWIKHPGYHNQGCCTPRFLQQLNNFKVAVCTSSSYGYLLRKIIEATACGCRVITDLPTDEVVPEIDDNLIRIHPYEPTAVIADIIREAYRTYDYRLQANRANKAKTFFDYHAIGQRLANDIEAMRSNYTC